MNRIYQDDRFHANEISIYTILPFNKKDIATLALLEFMLKNRARGYPSEDKIIAKSEELYALDLSFSNIYSLENIIVKFTFVMVDKRLVNQKDIYKKAIEFIFRLAFDDYLPRYNKKLIVQQKAILINSIQEVENRPQYIAAQGLYQALDPSWILSVSGYGTIEEINKITKEDLIDLHRRIIAAPKALIAICPHDEEEIRKELSSYFTFEGVLPPNFCYTRKGKEIVEVIKEKEIQQSRIMMGYALDVDISYYEAKLLSAMIGELGTSRLFVEIREEQGLCYSISSSLNPYNKMLFIASGVNIAHIDDAKEGIMKVIKELHFEKDELEEAKSLMKSMALSSSDSLDGLMQLLVQSVRNNEPTFAIERVLEGYDKVTLRRINYLVKHLHYQGTYILKGVMEG